MINEKRYKKINNQGMTLIEMMICFALLGLLMVAAAQVISSSTQVYYYTKATDYGIQASQIVATEIRGDLENAVAQIINPIFIAVPEDAKNNCFYISEDGKSVFFVDSKLNQISYRLEDNDGEKMLVREMCNTLTMDNSVKKFTKQYIGMNYHVENISFAILDRNGNGETNKLPIGDYVLIELIVTVENPQYGEYECIEYIPLYNLSRHAEDIANIIEGPHKTLDA